MKSLIKILVIFSFFISMKIYSEDELLYDELGIANWSTSTIRVDVYPVGAVFNGDKKYCLRCRNRWVNALGDTIKQIDGYSYDNLEAGTGKLRMNHDYSSSSPVMIGGSIGYGKYRIDIYIAGDLKCYCYADFSTSNYPFPGGTNVDMSIEYRGGSRITCWGGVWELPADKTVKIWEQPDYQTNQVKSGFITTNEDNGIWLNFPIIATAYGHETPEKCFLNVNILAQHQPKIICGDYFNLNLSVLWLKQDNTKLFIGNSDNNPTCGAGLTNGTGSVIILEPNTQIICEKSARLILRNQSNVRFDAITSKIFMKPGSLYCIEGSPRFYGAAYDPRENGSIIIQGLVKRYCPEYPAPSSPYFEDSIKVLLDTNATLEISDSTTWIFDGYESGLICKEGSTIKLGKGSKLVFTDGARINAKHTKFTTYDSNTTWNGIYLSGVSNDTLQYCTIENALNGINIEDKYSFFTSAPATEISNCEFSNKTSEQLLNMVYINNSENVMIRNCSSSSLISDGFASGVIIEYSTAGGVNVLNNEIEYVTTGINVIQSSPYIARNTITGSGTSGTGIYLDNSNGTIEYNIVNNFENSIKLYYSSPYVLKNTFNAGNSSDAYVTAYSAPVMRPIVSGTTLRWLGGNNYFTGQPGTAGIILESEGHPLMDSGYNVVSVGNSDYMQGTISRTLYLRVNNWYDDPPVSQKFDISGETIDYSEYFDGQSLPGTDYYELNEIGFGYYDTVYVKEIGGDNLTAEQIFILAYRKEMERKFTEAIVLYKNVITTYKNSNYAVSSVSRIFNCLEKSKAGNNAYYAVKTYYDGLKNSITYPIQIRELAEDLAIKAKVRMGFLEEAISDYQTIINNNQNNPKGIHAQVNKLVLMNMNGGGDNMLIGNKMQKESYKTDLLSLITGKKIQADNKITNTIPKQFKLYQNYPNPFNPKTTIKYDIPSVGQRHAFDVHITIYDITGREILQITEYKQAGSYSYTFDGTNYASGLYLYRLVVDSFGESGNFVETRKMVLMK